MKEKDFKIILGEPEKIEIKSKPIPERFCLWVLSGRHHDNIKSNRLKIFLTQQVYKEVNQHAQSERRQEVGGVIIGEVYKSENNEFYIVIEGSIKAELTKAGPIFVIFTHATWRNIYQIIEKEFHGKKVVGWYHTHPRMDSFFSKNDHYVHRTLFPHHWQVGLVIEPVKDIGGFFQWDGDEIKGCNSFCELIESDEQTSVVTWKNVRRQSLPQKEEVVERRKLKISKQSIDKDSSILKIPEEQEVISEDKELKNKIYDLSKGQKVNYIA